MNKKDFENKSLVRIILFGFGLNLFFGWVGFLFHPSSTTQVVLYQLGAACAISAAVMAARYTGLRGENVVASAFILLGITHGISLAALTSEGINIDREATMAMPMVPAMLFMFWCSLFPFWLRILALLPCISFTVFYFNFHTGNASLGWTLYLGYAALQVIELCWGWYLYADLKKQINVKHIS